MRLRRRGHFPRPVLTCCSRSVLASVPALLFSSCAFVFNLRALLLATRVPVSRRTRGLSMNNLDPKVILMKGREAELAAQQASQTRKRHSTVVTRHAPAAETSPTKMCRRSVASREDLVRLATPQLVSSPSLAPRTRALRAADRPRSMTLLPPGGGALPKEHPMNNQRFMVCLVPSLPPTCSWASGGDLRCRRPGLTH